MAKFFENKTFTDQGKAYLGASVPREAFEYATMFAIAETTSKTQVMVSALEALAEKYSMESIIDKFAEKAFANFNISEEKWDAFEMELKVNLRTRGFSDKTIVRILSRLNTKRNGKK